MKDAPTVCGEGYAPARDLKKAYKKSPQAKTSAVSGEETPELIFTKFCMQRDLIEMIQPMLLSIVYGGQLDEGSK